MKIEEKDIQYNNKYGYFSMRCAAICFVDGKVLLHKKVTDEFWNTVGGKIKLSETSEEALRREFLEELETDIKVLNMNMVIENFFEFNEKIYHEIIFLYNILALSELKFPMEKDSLIYDLFTIDEIKKLDIRPKVVKIKY